MALVAACVAFGAFLSESAARARTDKLQTLQLQELCQNLAASVDGSAVWNYQEPRTFDEWDQANAALDIRIATLTDNCKEVVGFVAPTRALKSVEARPSATDKQQNTEPVSLSNH